jgi:L-rhamnose mutarotase
MSTVNILCEGCGTPKAFECRLCTTPYCSLECMADDIFHPLTCISIAHQRQQGQILQINKYIKNSGHAELKFFTINNEPLMFVPFEEQVIEQADKIPHCIISVEQNNQRWIDICHAIKKDPVAFWEQFSKNLNASPSPESNFYKTECNSNSDNNEGDRSSETEKPTLPKYKWFVMFQKHSLVGTTRIQIKIPKPERHNQIFTAYEAHLKKLNSKKYSKQLKRQLRNYSMKIVDEREKSVKK